MTVAEFTYDVGARDGYDNVEPVRVVVTRESGPLPIPGYYAFIGRWYASADSLLQAIARAVAALDGRLSLGDALRDGWRWRTEEIE